MARSPQNNALAFVAEVARYLCSEVADVERMMQLDGLPYREIPKRTRRVKRIPLRDFQAWLLRQPGNSCPSLANYEIFLADFNQAGRKQPAAA